MTSSLRGVTSGPPVRTKLVRVHLAGGLSVELLVPGSALVLPEQLVLDALVIARRYVVLPPVPRVTLISTRESLPGDVALVHPPVAAESSLVRPARPRRATLPRCTCTASRVCQRHQPRSRNP